ncbi:alginate O-acetyltransferase AlgX-related protein [Verrucomicrobium spinosum]|uniref:alginate O-acetyltransferase AlgX-related protein n=1 Tax=Verrucomicrobium spinosum TaxID=2736 RepID=UPI0001745D7D|nr:alginate o-acetyltransferase AlgJ [Verrucomicrobium spinosum]
MSPGSRKRPPPLRLLFLLGLLVLAAGVIWKWPAVRQLGTLWLQSAHLPAEQDPDLAAVVKTLSPTQLAGINALRARSAALLRANLWPREDFIPATEEFRLYKKCLSCLNAPTSRYLEKTASLVEFHQLLRARGIRLILMPVPAAYAIHPDRVPGLDETGPRPQPGDASLQLRAFGEALRAAGIEFVDLSRPLGQAATEGTLCYFHGDSHWTPLGAEVGAATVASLLAPKAGSFTPADKAFIREWMPPSRHAITPPPLLQISVLSQNPVEARNPSTLLCDSNGIDEFDAIEAPSSKARVHGGFPSQVARAVGHRVDVITISGGGPAACRREFIRRCQMLPGYGASRQTVLMVFAERCLLLPLEAWPPLHLDRLTFAGEPGSPAPPHPQSGPSSNRRFKILQTSRASAPHETPYPAVLRSFVVELAPAPGLPAQKALLYSDHLRDRKPAAPDGLEPGTRWEATLLDWDAACTLNPGLAQIQRLDDVGDLELPTYYAVRGSLRRAP